MNLLLYLDPGTGSLLAYALAGILTSLLFMARNALTRLGLLLLGRHGDARPGGKFGIVIYAENGNYYGTFLPLLQEFIRNRKKVTYVTADRDDRVFGLDSEYVQAICPGNQYRTFAFLNGISADMVVSTTPHLDIYMWKRSKNVKRYVHVFHDPGSVDTYEKYGLSFYDVIIGAVPECEAAQRFLDERRGLPQKTYYTAGCMYLDLMVAERDSVRRNRGAGSVLYAPSWGAKSSLQAYGIQIIAGLLNAGHAVTFRPHPQSLSADRERIDLIGRRFGNNEKFKMDVNASGMEAMVNSDIMVSDFSSIIFDYSLLFAKPVLLASCQLGLQGYEAEDLPENLRFNVPMMRRISYELSADDIPSIAAIVERQLAQDQKPTRYSVPNFGTAGKRTFEIISEIEEGLK